MTYKEVIKKMESIGLAIDYNKIDVEDLEKTCENPEAFEEKIKKSEK